MTQSIFVDTRKQAIEQRREYRKMGLNASYVKLKFAKGYLVSGETFCFCWHKILKKLREGEK